MLLYFGAGWMIANLVDFFICHEPKHIKRFVKRDDIMDCLRNAMAQAEIKKAHGLLPSNNGTEIRDDVKQQVQAKFPEIPEYALNYLIEKVYSRMQG